MGGTAIVVLLDANDESFREAPWASFPVACPTVSRERALALAQEVLKKNGIEADVAVGGKMELVHLDSTPYYPHWRISGRGYSVPVGQDGSVRFE